MRIPKAILVRHLAVQHGTYSIAIPADVLRRWSYRELVAEHEKMVACGPCSLYPRLRQFKHDDKEK